MSDKVGKIGKLQTGSFRMLHRNWWRWCRKCRIKGNDLLVLIALEAGPWGAGHYTGLFHISVAGIADATGLEEREVSRAIKSLERMGAIAFDRREQIVFVRGMLGRQSPNFASSENTLLGIANHVERMPEGSPAVQEFIKAQRTSPELYEFLEGYLEGDSEQTLYLVPEDLDTLRHSSAHDGKKPRHGSPPRYEKMEIDGSSIPSKPNPAIKKSADRSDGLVLGIDMVMANLPDHEYHRERDLRRRIECQLVDVKKGLLDADKMVQRWERDLGIPDALGRELVSLVQPGKEAK